MNLESRTHNMSNNEDAASDLDANNEITTGVEQEVSEAAQGPSADPAVLEEMMRAGAMYGRKKSKTNPKMKRYIFTIRNGIEIFDLPQTLEMLGKAADFIKGVIGKGGRILIVGTRPAAQNLVKELAEKFNMPYVIERWLGGTLTNFKTISKRIEHFKNLKADKAAGKLEKYTKKERLEMDKQIEKFNRFFGGIESLSQLPDALLVVDTTYKNHLTAVREANRLKIPIVGIINSNADPDAIVYPIPANDSARSAIAWILNKIDKAIEEAKLQKAVEQPPVAQQPAA